MKSSKKKNGRFPLTSKKEEEARKKAEEFWSDPCWTEPLDQSQGEDQCSSLSSSS